MCKGHFSFFFCELSAHSSSSVFIDVLVFFFSYVFRNSFKVWYELSVMEGTNISFQF